MIELTELIDCFIGKTHIARRLSRYLSFFHAIPVEVFHAADYRRKHYGAINDVSEFIPIFSCHE